MDFNLCERDSPACPLLLPVLIVFEGFGNFKICKSGWYLVQDMLYGKNEIDQVSEPHATTSMLGAKRTGGSGL